MVVKVSEPTPVSCKEIMPGFGLKIQADAIPSPDTVKELLKTKGFAIIPRMSLDDDGFRDFIRSYGKVIEYKDEKANVGYGYGDILKLAGDPEKVVTGRGELPLHADGGLLLARVDVVFLYAKEIAGMNFQGATGIVNTELALSELPVHLKRVLEEEKFYARVMEKGYYVDASPADWFHIPVFTMVGGLRRTVLYFPFMEDGGQISWETRIDGFSDKECRDFFVELKAFMTQPRYYYKHFWRTGDMLMMDNRRVLHARDPFGPGVTRVLYRGQVSD